MSANTLVSALLADLQKLDEAGSDRALAVWSPEVPRAIIKTSLQERDRSTGYLVSQARTPDELTHPARAESSIGLTSEHNDGSEVRIEPATDALLRKRPRVEKQEVDVKQETIEIDSDDDDDESNANIMSMPLVSGQSNPTRGLIEDSSLTEHRKKQPAKLLVYLDVRSEHGNTVLRDIYDLPVLVQAELMRRFEDMWSRNHHRVGRYARFTRHPQNYASKPFCIRSMIMSGFKPAFKNHVHSEDMAYDRCVNFGHPCARFAEYEKEWVICIVPLPRSLRDGKTWDELGYWVL